MPARSNACASAKFDYVDQFIVIEHTHVFNDCSEVNWEKATTGCLWPVRDRRVADRNVPQPVWLRTLNRVILRTADGRSETYAVLIATSAPAAQRTVGFVGRMTEKGVRRDKAALSSGRKAHPANAAAGSNRRSRLGNAAQSGGCDSRPGNR
jgi:hypothetical protein